MLQAKIILPENCVGLDKFVGSAYTHLTIFEP